MSKVQDTYKEVKTFESPGWIIRVHIPDLTEEERARRMKQIHNAAADLMKGVISMQSRKGESNGT